MNAFNDRLRGGFGVYEYEEPVKIVWAHFTDSKDKLGSELIAKRLEIIPDHDHIEFETKD